MIDKTKLQNIKEKADGAYTARCPACAASGADEKGEHLIVYADGRFGCVVYPRDREHRGVVLKLAGDKSKLPRIIPKVDVSPLKTEATRRLDVVGQLGQKKRTAAKLAQVVEPPIASAPPPCSATILCPPISEVGKEVEAKKYQPWNEAGRDPLEAAREFLNHKP